MMFRLIGQEAAETWPLVRERGREGERETDRQTDRGRQREDRESECVCVCVSEERGKQRVHLCFVWSERFMSVSIGEYG